VVNEEATNLAAMPEDGVYIWGLYLEGCRWDDKAEALAESAPKVLFTKMKSIHILPMKAAEIDHGHTYRCPVYRTAERQGSLTTTGHNTNFVLYIYLPMNKNQRQQHYVKRGVAMLSQLSD
jgi:dynein heavy chain